MGVVLISVAGIGAVTIIADSNTDPLGPVDSSSVFAQKAHVPAGRVLGAAVRVAANNPVCNPSGCFYYQLADGSDQGISQIPVPQKQIIVSLDDQDLVYLEGTKVIGEFKISSGVASMPSPVGEFSVLIKKPVVNYIGATYRFPNTKWNLEFKAHAGGNYYIHGAYWHNNFGHPMSHGCINVSYANMEGLYNWADEGTKVTIQNDPVIPFADGSLVHDISMIPGTFDYRSVYIIENGEKRAFASAEEFNGLGYSISKALKGNLSKYPAGEPLVSLNSAHPQGTLVKDGPAIYKIASNGKQLFPNVKVFSSWGSPIDRVVDANSADMALPDLAAVKYRDGTLLAADSGLIYIMADGSLKQFSTAGNYGAKSSSLLTISDEEISQYLHSAILNNLLSDQRT